MSDPQTTLKPCPFCGKRMTQIMLASQNPGHESWVRCLACDASSKMCVAHAGKSAEEWAASFWNMREGVEDVAA